MKQLRHMQKQTPSGLHGEHGLQMANLINLMSDLLNIESKSVVCKSGKDRATIFKVSHEESIAKFGVISLLNLPTMNVSSFFHDFKASGVKHDAQQIMQHNDISAVTQGNSRFPGNMNFTALLSELRSIGFSSMDWIAGASKKAHS